MSLNDFLELVWRRKIIVIAVALIVVGGAVGALRLIDRQYEAESTIALKPTQTEDIFLLNVVDAVVPIYADAAQSRVTRDRAARLTPTRELGAISVRTYADSPIIRIRARATDPDVAQDSAQAVTEVLLDRARGGDVAVPGVAISQLDRPERPTAPVYPRPTLTIAVALLLGAAFGIGAALLRENLTTKVETPEALSRIVGVPAFGEIPPEPAMTRLSSPRELADDPRFRVVTEAVRDLRTNLLFAKGTLRSVAVTSPEGSHGKTSVAFALAVSLARSGARTLLIDADLRRGRLAEMVNVQRQPGLSEVLRGTPLEDAIRHSSLDTLDFVTGGRLGEDPGELLTSEFPAVLAHSERLYDTVVVDCTPLVPVSDARVIARYAGATLLVASALTTTRRQLRTAVERLSVISVQPTAVVLNHYRSPTKSAYYGPAPHRNGREDHAAGPTHSTTRV